MTTPASTPVVSIIVVSYNTKQMTLDCLATVYEQTNVPFELIVVDNASNDGSAEAIAEAFPDLTLIAETTNHGFAPAHDVALPHTHAPWLLLLNPDTLVLDGAIDTLLAFAERTPDAGIWGGRSLYGDKSLNPYSCWRAMSLWTVFCRSSGLTGIFPKSGLFNAEEYAGWNRDTERAVDIVTGCFFLIKRETWDLLGGFDPDFVMYGEEADLCLRARKMGLQPRITPDAVIVHYGGASEPVAADRIIRVIRAKAELILRHFPSGTKRLGQGLFLLFPLSRRIATTLGHKVLARDSLQKKSKVWSEVWERRSEWKDGFPKG
jgi:GT2 family glycosyltransferase